MTIGQRLALATMATAVAGGMGAIVLRIVAPVPHVENSFGLADAALTAFVILGIAFAAVGALLVVRRAGRGIGWYLIATGCGYGLSMLTGAITSLAVAHGGTDHPAAGVAGWLTVVGSSVGGLTLFYLAFIFPTGRSHSRGWDIVRRSLVVVTILPWLVLVLGGPGPLHLFPTIDNPFGFGPDPRRLFGIESMGGATAAGSALLGAVSVAAVITRYRSAGRIEQQQLKWFISAVVLSAAGLALTTLAGLAEPEARPELPITIYALACTSVPVAIGIAILRYRLYDIDRLISRTIAYGIVSAALVAAYGASFLLLLGPLSAVSGGEAFAVAASTLVVATLFQPLRRRIQAAVDRRFHRARYDAEWMTAAFADRVRNEVDVTALAAELDRTVRTAMEPSRLGLWLRERERSAR